MAKYFRKDMTGIYFNTHYFKTTSVNYRNRISYSQVTVDTTTPPPNFVKQKLDHLVSWYENITGLDEVRVAQNRVLQAEDKFITAQEKRREANKNVALVQSKLKEIYGELDIATRGEDRARYIQLITQEDKLLKEEKEVVAEFQKLESDERNYFSALSSAVKDSHEKERAQAERTKYWSLIGSILGTVIGVVGSSINNHLKMKELKRLVTEAMLKNPNHQTNTNTGAVTLSTYDDQLVSFISETKSVMLNAKVNMEELRKNDEILLRTVQELQSFLDQHFKEMMLVKSIPADKLNHQHIVPLELEEKLEKQQYQIKLILATSGVLTIILPLVLRYFGIS